MWVAMPHPMVYQRHWRGFHHCNSFVDWEWVEIGMGLGGVLWVIVWKILYPHRDGCCQSSPWMVHFRSRQNGQLGGALQLTRTRHHRDEWCKENSMPWTLERSLGHFYWIGFAGTHLPSSHWGLEYLPVIQCRPPIHHIVHQHGFIFIPVLASFPFLHGQNIFRTMK